MKWVTKRVRVDDINLQRLRRPIEAAAFWAAIGLPFLHVPLLVRGFGTTQEIATFVALLLLNVIAFVIGHPYSRE